MSLKSYLNYLQLQIKDEFTHLLPVYIEQKYQLALRPVLGCDVQALVAIDLAENLDPWQADNFAYYGAKVNSESNELSYQRGAFGVVIELIPYLQEQTPTWLSKRELKSALSSNNVKSSLEDFAKYLYTYRNSSPKVSPQVDLKLLAEQERALAKSWQELLKIWKQQVDLDLSFVQISSQLWQLWQSSLYQKAFNVISREYKLEFKIIKQMLEGEFELFYDFVQTYLAEVLEVTLLVLEGKLLQARERAWLIPAWDNFQGEVNKKFYQQELGVNQLVGFICFEAQFEMLNLDNITINADFRKCAFAQLLLDLMFAFGRWQETTNYLLEVRESNTPAITLYQKNKFRLINKRYSYYRNSLNGQAEDALIYQLLLE